MRYFTHYWQNDTWDKARSSRPSGSLLDGAASNSFQNRGVAFGDAIYIVTNARGQLQIAAKIIVDRIETEDVTDSNKWSDHALPSASTPVNWDFTLPLDEVKKIRFLPENTSPVFSAPTQLDQQTFRGVREITPDSALMIDQWLPPLKAVGTEQVRFGEIPGYPEGSAFQNREELSRAYLHRPQQAGIWGRGGEGAFSIVLSGGYVDDEDHGDEIIYTGEGGRDPSTGQQVFDQPLTKGNLALAKSHAEGLPVRVIRGSGHRSRFSPVSGYRYDGLYRVDEYWQARSEGGRGPHIWRYKLVKLAAIESATHEFGPTGSANSPPDRKEVTTLRIVRDTRICRAIKNLYHHKCQICGIRIETPGGPYAEGAHIRPLGRPHNGSDSLDNLLCLCPNHHVMFDNMIFTITDDFELIGLVAILDVHPDHQISRENLRYHREHRYHNPMNR